MGFQNNDSVTLLGTRGSCPVSGKEFHKYGGATLSVLVRLAGRPLLIDCGTGMLSLKSRLSKEERSLPVLLSHAHIDHILGLSAASYMFSPDAALAIYGKGDFQRDVAAQIGTLFTPPLWPVGISAFPAKTTFCEMKTAAEGDFETMTNAPEGFDIKVLEGHHPGGVRMFRVESGGKSVAYCSDCTLKEPALAKAVALAQNCDLLICDGQYDESEWKNYSAFGHSTWQMAADFARACGAGRLRIVHHSPYRTDAELDSFGAKLQEMTKGENLDYSFGYDGEEILL